MVNWMVLGWVHVRLVRMTRVVMLLLIRMRILGVLHGRRIRLMSTVRRRVVRMTMRRMALVWGVSC